jgi:uncharacterized protein involved in outer membrane biogenesis
MSRRRGCLLVVAAATLLLLGGAFAAYRALDADALRGSAERELTALLGQPVTIGRISVRLFPVPAVTGMDVRVGSAGADHAPGVSVGAVRILPQWRTLLSRPVVVDTVDVEGLTARVRRDRERRWILPGAATGAPRPGGGGAGAAVGGVPGLPGGGASDTVAVRRVRLRDGRIVVVDDVLRTRAGSAEVAAISGIEADLVQRPNGAGVLSMRAALGGSDLTGNLDVSPRGLSASLQSPSLRNQDLPALFALLGSAAPPGLSIGGAAPLELRMQVARDSGALTASGRLRAGRVQFDTLAVTEFSAPFRLAENVVVVEPVAFAAYGGTGRGTLHVRPEGVPAWMLDMRLDGLDINAFLSANTGAGDRLRGTGQLVVRVRGTADAPVDRHMTGTVDVVLSNGVIRNFALLAAINRALRITGGDASDTRFERLSATLALAGGAIRTDNASLHAGELTATAAGALGVDRRINMTGVAVFSREASARMIASVNQVSGAKNERGEVEVPFRVTGPIAEPAVAIDAEKILRRALQKEVDRNIRKQLDRLLRRP